jgi:hypothetical protein
MQIGLKRGLLSRKTFIIGGTFLIALLIVLGGITLFYKVYASPQKVFWDMIDNNLTTRGFTKLSVRSSSGTISNETIQVTFVPTLKVHGTKKVVNKANGSRVTLDSIGTPAADYQRYSQIEQPAANGKKADYSKIYSLWLKNGGNDYGNPQIVNSVAFGAVLFGDLTTSQKDKIMGQLKDSYRVKFDEVGRKNNGTRRTYTYFATVPLKKYAVAAHNYASMQGLPVASQISPANYSDSAKLEVRMTVDVLSRQLRKIEYVNQGITENYSSYGVEPTITPPAHTATVQEFNKALAPLQNQ